MQAQIPADPYVALWTRRVAFRSDELGRRDMGAVSAEGERLLAFTDPKASHEVNVVQATKSVAGPARTRTRAASKSRVTLERVRKKEA